LATANPNTFEVETRYHFQSRAEMFAFLPLLQPCFTRVNQWTTTHYGRELFGRDIILRIGATLRPTGNLASLGWKGPDTGSFANIRAERDEEITNGINSSWILELLGGVPDAVSPAAVAAELTRLGHAPFMEFAGANQFGLLKSLNLQLKMMECPVLRWPLLLEVEKTAHTPAEALKLEQDLIHFTKQYGLVDRVVHDEPPTLLYQAVTFPGQ
jgi:hypothetical protein